MMNNNDQQQNPELQRFADSEHIAEGKRAGIGYAADVARNSLYNLHPQLYQEAQAQYRAQERQNTLDVWQQTADVVDGNPILEAEMRMLDQQQEKRDMAELKDKSRSMVEEAMPMPSSQFQVETPSMADDANFLAEARAGVDAAVMNDVERYLENIGGTTNA